MAVKACAFYLRKSGWRLERVVITVMLEIIVSLRDVKTFRRLIHLDTKLAIWMARELSLQIFENYIAVLVVGWCLPFEPSHNDQFGIQMKSA